VWGLAVALAGLTTVQSLARYREFRSGWAWDLAYNNQWFWALLYGDRMALALERMVIFSPYAVVL
jgi:hypothetical protein